MSDTSTARIRSLLQAGDDDRAVAETRVLLAEVIGRSISDVRINRDVYSLNSVNGFARDDTGLDLFFKFHQEEDEAAGVEEYYNAQVLQAAGYPVSMPLFCSTLPGRQLLVYRRESSPRLADVCAAIEAGDDRFDPDAVTAAQVDADRRFAQIAIATLGYAARPPVRPAPLFQLFYHRLVDSPSTAAHPTLGGRVARFYLGRHVDWPGLSMPFDELAKLRWRINGVDYPMTLREAFEEALIALDPTRFVPGPVVTAHGDAHNANVWYRESRQDGPGGLRLFDPAFAGAEVPALLAEVKATFHNIFAHPFWLYEPVRFATRVKARAAIVDGRIDVHTDYALTPLRQAFLHSKATRFWRPLLAQLDAQGWLPSDWERTVRSALFACPTLVMPLLPGPDSSHNPVSSLVGFCQALRCAVAPVEAGEDDVTRFFASCRLR